MKLFLDFADSPEYTVLSVRTRLRHIPKHKYGIPMAILIMLSGQAKLQTLVTVNYEASDITGNNWTWVAVPQIAAQ